jgi:hypothetical protein
MAAYQLHLRHCLHPVEVHRLAPTAAAEAGRMASMDVVILGTAEGAEGEADTTTDLAVYLQGSGEGVRRHQTESLASVEEEGKGMAVTGVGEGGGDGSWTQRVGYLSALLGLDRVFNPDETWDETGDTSLSLSPQSASQRYYRRIAVAW